MITVCGKKDYSYPITKSEHIFSLENDALLYGGDAHPGARRFVIVDKNVYRLYKGQIEGYFRGREIETRMMIVDSGDQHKSEKSYIRVFGELCKYDLKRRSEPILAIGGGVVTDLAGFIASTYRRGVPHIKVPTTLMGYVDASVGIKTGVNFGPFKNRMGSFEIPAGVVLDREFLRTLDRRNTINGIGEIVKLAVILDRPLFDMLEEAGASLIANRFQDVNGQTVLDRAIAGMVEELAPNLYESDLRRKVDFGHTFSLVIESGSDYEIMHGEAVAIDVLFSSYLSYQREFLSESSFERIVALFKSLQLPMWSPQLRVDLLWDGLLERVMHRDGAQLIPLPIDIGACDFINDLDKNELRRAVAAFEAEFSRSAVA